MEIEDSDINPYETYMKPRKITKVKSSPFEIAEAVHSNKKYWDSVFRKIDTSTSDIVSVN